MSLTAGQGPIRIGATTQPWPLHDAASTRAAEMAALQCRPPGVLMQAAGLSLARLALALLPDGRSVQVWVGPGNNGGDGLVAARLLQQAGKAVQVLLWGDPKRRPADAACALRDTQNAGVAIRPGDSDAAPASDLRIDALLGLGACRPPAGALAAAIAQLNAGRGPLLAVDVPSGLHPDTGMPLGSDAVHATDTLALLSLKIGCHTGLGRAHAGTVWLDDLGIGAGAPVAWLAGAPPRAARPAAGHKGSHGDVAVVGGAQGMTGAAWLAARAALAAGAGRVYCSLLDLDAPGLDADQPELMARQRWWLSPPTVLARTTVVCGCGGGADVAAALPPLLAHAARLVLDADALNAIAADAALQGQLQRRGQRGLQTLLTPHPLEAARLLQTTAGAVQADRLAAATRLAVSCAGTVLLKGSGSVIAAAGRLPTVNPTGNAALGSAGTGDVLAGYAAGLWAQAPEAAAADIACQAAWLHGRAADRWPAAARGAPLRASALVHALAQHDAG